jgi:hypothetical protein
MVKRSRVTPIPIAVVMYAGFGGTGENWGIGIDRQGSHNVFTRMGIADTLID